MAKFKSFTDDSLSYATFNYAELSKKMIESPSSNDWLEEFFKDHKLQSTSFNFDFELKYDEKDPKKYDFENAKLIYETLENANIGPAIIYNNKFFPAFALQCGYKYYMTHFLSPKEHIKSIKGTLLFDGDARRSMARNIVGRLYLLVVLSLDKDNENRYEYTEYVLNHPGLRRMVFYTFVDNDVARLAFIRAVIRYERENNTSLSGTKIHRILTHLSCLSNVSHVKIMEEVEVEDYLYDFIKEIEVSNA